MQQVGGIEVRASADAVVAGAVHAVFARVIVPFRRILRETDGDLIKLVYSRIGDVHHGDSVEGVTAGG